MLLNRKKDMNQQIGGYYSSCHRTSKHRSRESLLLLYRFHMVIMVIMVIHVVIMVIISVSDCTLSCYVCIVIGGYLGQIPVCLVGAHARRGRTAHLCPHYGHVEAQHAFRLQTSCKLKAHMNHRWAPPRRRARALAGPRSKLEAVSQGPRA